jgi:hypothetical protein
VLAKYLLYLEEKSENDDTEENWPPSGDHIADWGHTSDPWCLDATYRHGWSSVVMSEDNSIVHLIEWPQSAL